MKSKACRWWVACLWGALTVAGVAQADSLEGVVTKVTDGDTIWVRPVQCSEAVRCRLVKIRMQGIDAPERCQAWGTQATQALRSRLLNQTVQVNYSSRDVYGRVLGQVFMGREDIGAWMVKQGHAWSYRERRNAGPYAPEQARAERSGLGLFSESQATEPRVFRKRHGPCGAADPLEWVGIR